MAASSGDYWQVSFLISFFPTNPVPGTYPGVFLDSAPIRWQRLLLSAICATALAAGASQAQNTSTPDRVRAAYQRGVASAQRGDLAGARRAFEQAIRLSPRTAELHASLGQVLLQQGEVDRAVAEFRKAITLKPALAQSHTFLGTALLRR